MVAFNYEQFKARWRAICDERKVDPVNGATSFQVAAYKAEVVEQGRREQAAARAWAQPAAMDVLRDWPKVVNDIFEIEMSAVESAVMREVYRDAKRLHGVPLPRRGEPLLPTIREIWREVKAEMSLYDLRWLPATVEPEDFAPWEREDDPVAVFVMA